ncbi:hypothetical protein PR048_012823 [Dryococelus australis]|uniref:Uncharacterized protein n=1 Tax=Dryococelus australis TaxID=614101 RepID=A0ABQ9HRA1_9NEOP|nr:hypothetical protein PR048_012823 [Dryococelus australis]
MHDATGVGDGRARTEQTSSILIRIPRLLQVGQQCPPVLYAPRQCPLEIDGAVAMYHLHHDTLKQATRIPMRCTSSVNTSTGPGLTTICVHVVPDTKYPLL